MRFLKRHFTVMVVAGAQARLRRFQIKGMHLAWGAGSAALVMLLALGTPLIAWWARGLHRDLVSVTEERNRLAQRSGQIEETLAEMRQRLETFEARTAKLAEVADIQLPDLRHRAQGSSTSIAQLPASAKADALLGESDVLSERSASLERRLDLVERAVTQQAERMARIPSIMPVSGLIGAGYGWRRDPITGLREFHRGVDIEANHGAPVIAPADGVVLRTERHAGYGNLLYISHGDGLVTRYGHLSAFKVRAGQRVHRGDLIAAVGSTGHSTGPHLHYEVLRGGGQIDPLEFLRPRR